MQHIKTQEEWEIEMSLKILEFIKNELYLDMRFFHLALSSLSPKPDASLQAFASDGTVIRYAPLHLMQVFQKNSRFLNRAYLHSVLHCVFSHLWTAGNRSRSLWNISCDIAAEYTIDHMEIPSVRRILTWLRKKTYETLEAEIQYLSAPAIYRFLCKMDAEQIPLLAAEFYTDDHRFWPESKQPDKAAEQARNQWEKIARQTRMQQEMHREDPSETERLFAMQIKAGRSRRNYRDFLKKFTMLREEMHCSPDEFDLNFYTYGLQLYGNMPLIEPVETREIKKIQEFVIVIDTSASTSGELVRNFLRETFQILHQRDYFFSSCKIRILQCDDRVRMDQEITDFEQSEAFLAQFTITGGGGTSFVPAFAYVHELLEQGVFHHLGGLLYFTDGKGTYPKKRPPYPAAFLFLGDFIESDVPPWAMRLKLEPEEFLLKQKHYGRDL